MTHEEVFQMLEGSGLPVIYYSWPENMAPSLPYLVYYYPNSADEYADNTNHQKNMRLNVELYTKQKDFDLEAQIGTILNNNGLTYSTSEGYLDSEEMYEILFETEVIINGE